MIQRALRADPLITCFPQETPPTGTLAVWRDTRGRSESNRQRKQPRTHRHYQRHQPCARSAGDESKVNPGSCVLVASYEDPLDRRVGHSCALSPSAVAHCNNVCCSIERSSFRACLRKKKYWTAGLTYSTGNALHIGNTHGQYDLEKTTTLLPSISFSTKSTEFIDLRRGK